MSEKGKKPKIRFKGFNDEWEERKLGEITTSYSGGTPTVGILEYYNGNIPFIRSGEINKKRTELFITELGYANSSAAMVDKGDILYALYGATSGEVCRSQLKGAINQAILAIKPNEQYDANFLTQWLMKQKKNILSVYLQGGQGNLSGTIVKSLQVNITNLFEQQKIGNYFSNLSNLINIYQNEYDKLVNIKKSMLEKMFPKNGKTVPEIRFKGFTESWKNKKVSEITKFHKQGYYTTEFYDDNKKYYLLRGSDLVENKLVLKNTPKINATEKDYNAFKVEIGDFLIVRSGTIGTYGIVYTNIPAIFGSYLINFRFDKSQVENEFFGYFYQSNLFKSQMKQIIQQSANTNINAENIKSINIKLPNIEEQEKIGEYFYKLDRIITLQQKKLEKLKNFKKAFLEKMFV